MQVEDEEAGQPLGCRAGDDLPDKGADVVADDADPIQLQGLDQGLDVGGVNLRPGALRGPGVGLLAVAEAAQVGSQELETFVLQQLHDRLPGSPELGPAVQENDGAAEAAARQMERHAVDPDLLVPHRVIFPGKARHHP